MPQSKSWDRLAQVAVIAGVIDLIITGVAATIYKVKFANQVPGESSKQLVAAMSEIPGIARLFGVGIPLFAAALVVVGVGLLRETPWARRAALVWSLSAIGFLVASVAIDVTFVWPHIAVARQEEIQRGASEGALLGYNAVQFLTLRMALIRLPFPLILLRKLRKDK